MKLANELIKYSNSLNYSIAYFLLMHLYQILLFNITFLNVFHYNIINDLITCIKIKNTLHKII